MNNLEKRSVLLAGHATSVALEPEFWKVLGVMAETQCKTVSELLAHIDGERGERPLASACRLAALRFSNSRKAAL